MHQLITVDTALEGRVSRSLVPGSKIPNHPTLCRHSFVCHRIKSQLQLTHRTTLHSDVTSLCVTESTVSCSEPTEPSYTLTSLLCVSQNQQPATTNQQNRPTLPSLLCASQIQQRVKINQQNHQTFFRHSLCFIESTVCCNKSTEPPYTLPSLFVFHRIYNLLQ